MFIGIAIGIPLGKGSGGTPAAPDTTKPIAVSFSPVDNAINISINVTPVVIFDEIVTLGATGNVTLKRTLDNVAVDTWDVATEAGSAAGKIEVVGGNQLTMHLSTALVNNTGYYIIWDAGVVKDAANNGVLAQASTTLWSFTTVDVVAPVVVLLSPLDNAVNVPSNSSLVVSFNEPVTLGSGFVYLKRTSDDFTFDSWDVANEVGTGAGQVTVVGGTELTMRPTSNLASLTDYYVTWDGGVVKDVSNNPVAAQVSTTYWNFTSIDTVAPLVLSRVPLDNATGVSVNANLTATFNETVTLGSGVISLKRTSDNVTVDDWVVPGDAGSIAGKVEVVGGTVLTLHLSGNLASFTGYYVVWDAGVVKDAANNPVAAQSLTTVWNFTTSDVVAPTIVSFDPLDNAVGVATDYGLIVTFSEAIIANSGFVTLKRTLDNAVFDNWNIATDSGPGPGKFQISGSQLILRPANLTAELTGYYVVWDAGIVRDAAGNLVAAQVSTTAWSFTTADETGPLVISISPLDNAVSVPINVTPVVTFNETVTLGASGHVYLKRTVDNTIIEDWNIATDVGGTAGKLQVTGGNVLTLRPTINLSYSIGYYLVWDVGVVKDASNNPVLPLTSTTAWSFTTAAAAVSGRAATYHYLGF